MSHLDATLETVEVQRSLILTQAASSIFIHNYIERCLRRATPTPTICHEKGNIVRNYFSNWY
ncbi:MAG: hypothetical protein V7K48_00115 [Nostoc sp.]|uniref:hypothetical protein n=1 Tax=Nostoc sp. TaxID=1180 RepID=UPI002FFA32E0